MVNYVQTEAGLSERDAPGQGTAADPTYVTWNRIDVVSKPCSLPINDVGPFSRKDWLEIPYSGEAARQKMRARHRLL
jgi:hypothetical protein